MLLFLVFVPDRSASEMLLHPPPSLTRPSPPRSGLSLEGSSLCPQGGHRRSRGRSHPCSGLEGLTSPPPFIPQVSPNPGRGLVLSLLLLVVLLLGWGLQVLQ